LSRSEAGRTGDANEGEIVVMEEAGTIPLPDGWADHVVVPEVHDRVRRLVPGELARIARREDRLITIDD
jgi:hypothetical protein